MGEYIYWRSCTGFPVCGREYEALVDMIDRNIQITRRTFLKHVSREDLDLSSDCLGYAKHPSQGLTMAGDWHISYHRSKYMGKTVYYFRHSAIEYIFVVEAVT
jgi:hypothetical protein